MKILNQKELSQKSSGYGVRFVKGERFRGHTEMRPFLNVSIFCEASRGRGRATGRAQNNAPHDRLEV